MNARLALPALLICLLFSPPAVAQPGLGVKIWEDVRAKYPISGHYAVDFSFERHGPMTRSNPEKARMTYSNGKFTATLSDITWYYDGDTLWEVLPGQRRPTVNVSTELHPDAFSPSEIIGVLGRRPVSVRHHGQADHNGEMCDKLRLDLHDRGLSYESCFLWVNEDLELKKVIFLDRYQVASTIHVFQIRTIPPPSSGTFRYTK